MVSTPEAVLALSKEQSAQKLVLGYKGEQLASGAFISKADAPKPPSLKYVGGSSEQYIAIMIDVDAPYESFSILSPILHWVQTGLTAGPDGTLTSSVTTTADWVQPAPPPGAGPHKYIVVLYPQPVGFDASKWSNYITQPMSLTKRIRFDLAGFVAAAGLGEPLAASYFTSN
ncbi:hypothetical protein AMS68_000975 [Peltaster fructicola]|uniref:Phosphatidylethanolamine-binding protein n=1 Tax=Peltaster fructicola TaxID=286661 RepID=A0A6H0XLF5_9PEZI|nr:hypothetical protein AMS68_000975 [Peltaster fructicola]